MTSPFTACEKRIADHVPLRTRKHARSRVKSHESRVKGQESRQLLCPGSREA